MRLTRMSRRTRDDDPPAAKALRQPPSDVVSAVVRTVLARELRGLVVRREHLTQPAAGHRVPFPALFAQVQEHLEDVYGMSLQAVDEADLRVGAKARYMVVNILTPESRSVLARMWQRRSGPISGHLRSQRDRRYLLPRHASSGAAAGSRQLVFGGLAFAVMLLVVAGDNHLADADLYARLLQWGIVEDTNTSLGVGAPAVVGELERIGIICRDTAQSYQLGPRARAELHPRSVFAAIGAVYGDAFGPQERQQALNSVLRVWPGVLGVDSENPTYGDAEIASRIGNPETANEAVSLQ